MASTVHVLGGIASCAWVLQVSAVCALYGRYPSTALLLLSWALYTAGRCASRAEPTAPRRDGGADASVPSMGNSGTDFGWPNSATRGGGEGGPTTATPQSVAANVCLVAAYVVVCTFIPVHLHEGGPQSLGIVALYPVLLAVSSDHMAPQATVSQHKVFCAWVAVSAASVCTSIVIVSLGAARDTQPSSPVWVDTAIACSLIAMCSLVQLVASRKPRQFRYFDDNSNAPSVHPGQILQSASTASESRSGFDRQVFSVSDGRRSTESDTSMPGMVAINPLASCRGKSTSSNNIGLDSPTPSPTERASQLVFTVSSALRHLPVACVVLSEPDHAILSANSQACVVFGVPGEDSLLLRPIRSIAHMLSAAVSTPDGSASFKASVQNTNHPLGRVTVACERCFVPQLGAFVQTMVFDNSSDELAITHKTLVQRNEALSVLSHELRNPLQAILGMTTLVLDMPETTEAQEDHLRHVQSAGHHMRKMLTGLLELQQLQRPEVVEYSPCHILTVFEEELGKVAASVRNDVQLNLRCMPGVPTTLLLDVDRVRQIVSNFLENACKFCDHGAITVAVSVTKSSCEESPALEALSTPRCTSVLTTSTHYVVCISVTDTGIGMTAEQRECLFNEFSQVHDRAAMDVGGFGIGLAISKGLAEACGGSIEVASEPNQFTMFAVHLPTADAVTPRLPSFQSLHELDRPIGPASSRSLLASALTEVASVCIVSDGFHPHSVHAMYHTISAAQVITPPQVVKVEKRQGQRFALEPSEPPHLAFADGTVSECGLSNGQPSPAIEVDCGAFQVVLVAPTAYAKLSSSLLKGANVVVVRPSPLGLSFSTSAKPPAAPTVAARPKEISFPFTMEKLRKTLARCSQSTNTASTLSVSGSEGRGGGDTSPVRSPRPALLPTPPTTPVLNSAVTVIESATDTGTPTPTCRVLVLDDSRVNCLLMRRFATHVLSGSMSVTVDDMTDPTTLVRRPSDAPQFPHYDIVLTDFHMGAATGGDVCQFFRDTAGAAGNAPPTLVLVTGDPSVVQHYAAHGADDALAKPVTMEQLARCLQRHGFPALHRPSER